MSSQTLELQLSEAVIANDVAGARRALELGAALDDPAAGPPLLTAIYARREKMVRLLLDAGASVSATDPKGNTALFCAVVSALRPITRDLDAADRIFGLIAQRAPKNAFNKKDYQGLTAAMRLILSERPQFARHVLSRSDLSIVSPAGCSVLELALIRAREADAPLLSAADLWGSVDLVAQWVDDRAIEQAAQGGFNAGLAPGLAARVEAITLRSHIAAVAAEPVDAKNDASQRDAGEGLRSGSGDFSASPAPLARRI